MLLRCCLVERMQRMLLAALQPGTVGQHMGPIWLMAVATQLSSCRLFSRLQPAQLSRSGLVCDDRE
jgi:hypothetical protein